jgi:hypothetical protein
MKEALFRAASGWLQRLPKVADQITGAQRMAREWMAKHQQ